MEDVMENEYMQLNLRVKKQVFKRFRKMMHYLEDEFDRHTITQAEVLDEALAALEEKVDVPYSVEDGE
jgi:hypothetical protein